MASGKHGKVPLKKVRVFAKPTLEKKQEASPSSLFVFCEKNTGVAQFRTQSFADTESSVERMAGLLAMQCLVRGQEPEDFVVLVPAERTFVDRLRSRSSDLLEEARSINGPSSLSPRQKEILRSVLCNRANKEIACKLNITVRTVKFHISTLLSKFGVQNRMELARRAAGLLQSTGTDVPFAEESVAQPQREIAPVAMNQMVSRNRTVRFPTNRVATA